MAVVCLDMVTRAKLAAGLDEKVMELFPEIAKELVRVAGLNACLTLVQQFGGTEICIPQGKNARGIDAAAAFEELIGVEALKALQKHFVSCEKLYIPSCTKAMNFMRNSMIVCEFDMLIAQGESANNTVKTLALRFSLSDRRIWEILKEFQPLSAASA